MSGLDATLIVQRLYVGSAPPTGFALAQSGFNALVLAANEYQPKSFNFPGVFVIHAPIDDGMQVTAADASVIEQAGILVAQMLGEGRNVLCTCRAGRNRSAVIAARALMIGQGMSGSQAIDAVRSKRKDRDGVSALENPAFQDYLLRMHARDYAGRTRTVGLPNHPGGGSY